MDPFGSIKEQNNSKKGISILQIILVFTFHSFSHQETSSKLTFSYSDISHILFKVKILNNVMLI